ncbi:MAG: SAM-dependent methyltransferase [Candidatus Aminicenantaceae bacterium]
MRDGKIYRQINNSYQKEYDYLINSGLYNSLVNAELLIPHKEVDIPPEDHEIAYKIIKPEVIPFISYPYEFCFRQLKDAALITLKVQKMSLQYGMTLKDASVYNIQFRNGKPIFIDTLSFEKYEEGRPWVAYRQFCQHFLAPLTLMRYKDVRLNQLFKIHLDGIPLNLASSLLPFFTKFIPSILIHIHIHAYSQRYFANKNVNIRGKNIRFISHLGLIDNLESFIKKLTWRSFRTEWINYYKNQIYSVDAFQHKKQIISDYLDRIKPKQVWDLGANTGVFSRVASEKGIETISFDIDPGAVEKNYIECINRNEKKILPLIIDITNPSPAIGWENRERLSFIERGPTDAVLALAIIHHLAISNNLPFENISNFFSKLCKYLIIEYIPKNDIQVKGLLKTRKDIFHNYDQENFEQKFGRDFKIQISERICNSDRILYLMKAKNM